MQARHRRRYDSKPIRAAVEMLESRLLLTSVVVNSVGDAIGGSLVTLRDAIADANKSTTPTTITFDPGVFSSNKTIMLGHGGLGLSNTKEPTTIIGPAAGVTVNAGGASQVMFTLSNVTATLENMTITGGDSSDFDGGGIVNNGMLTLNNSTISGNTAEIKNGGGICNYGTLSLTDSTVSGNNAGQVSYVRYGAGAGIYSLGTLTLTNSTVSGNNAAFAGGGIASFGKMTLTDSTVSGNTAGAGGGGIENGGAATLTNVTVSGNSADGANNYAGGGGGGGIYAGGDTTLTNVTVSNNSALGTRYAGGGIWDNSTTVTISNCIIAGNTALSAPDYGGLAHSFGNNLIGIADGVSGLTFSDLKGTAAKPLNADLGYLADNGGPTGTLLPLPGSAAIGNGSTVLIPKGITTDQRGLPRTYGGKVDIGAVEVQPSVVAAEISFNGVTPHGTYIAGRNVEGFVGIFEPIDTTGPYTVAVNWGDGTADTSFSVAANLSAFNELTAYHTYKSTSSSANVNGTLSFTVTDAKGVKSNSSGYAYTLTPAVATNAFSGEVFYDANDDGKLASTESGIAGVGVYDDINNNGVVDAGEPSATTSSTGAFTLNIPGTGTGVIRTEGVPPDTQTAPASNGGYKVTLAGTTTQSSLNFGYYKSGGNFGGGTSITGTVFNDANKNGKLDSGEAGLGGVTVYDDANNNGKLDPGELYADTNASGVYTLDLGSFGTALLRQVVPAGDTQSLPAGGAGIQLTLGLGAKFTNENFGDYVPPATLTGTVYGDANKNGKQDSGELPLAGWEVYDDVNENGKLDPGEPFAFTNSTGGYTFTLTGSGTAYIRQIVPDNWSQTAPASNAAIKIAFARGLVKTGNNFGDYTAIKYLSTVATTSGLVAWWTFDNSSQANSIINGYTGTLKGGGAIIQGAGAPISGDNGNGGLSLGTGNGYVDTDLTTQQTFTTTHTSVVAGKPVFTTTAAVTLNVWINIAQLPGPGEIETILAKSQLGNDMDLQLQSDGKIYFYTDNTIGASFTPPSWTRWHMLTAEFDTAVHTREIFWDGKLVISTNPYTEVHAPSVNAFSIGDSDLWPGRYFSGNMDEASLWNRALTASEIAAIYNAAAVKADGPTTVTGTVFNDSNGNGTKDTGDAGLAGWEVYDDVNNVGFFESGDPFTFTAPDGTYSLSVTGQGMATIRQIVPANWSHTTAVAISVPLDGSPWANNNFGDHTAVSYLSTVATTSGLVAWWTFDSSSQANSVVNGYTGTLKGGAKIAAASGAPIAGESASGLSLNGTSAYVDTDLTTQQEFTTTRPVIIDGKPAFVTTAAVTLNVWVHIGSIPQSGSIETILAKSQFQNDMDLQLQSDGKIYFYTDNTIGASFKPASLTGWHMLTAEFDTAAQTREIFWDGKLAISTNPFTEVHAPSINPFSIGESDVFPGRYYDGSIDEVSLWDRALSAAEILAIYNASK